MIVFILLLLLLIPGQESYHVVFEQIGELASSVTYIHVKLTIDLVSIEEHIGKYSEKLVGFKGQTSNKENYQMPEEIKKTIVESSAYALQRQIIQRHIEASQRILSNRIITASQLFDEVQQLKNVMPIPSEKDTMLIQGDSAAALEHVPPPPGFVRKEKSIISKVGELVNQTINKLDPIGKIKYTVHKTFQNNPVLKDIVKGRNARFFNPIGFALGAFGTFMGLYNRKQIENLREEISQKHGLLVEVVQDHKKQTSDMSANLHVLKGFIASSHFYDLSVFISEIMDVENEIRKRIEWAAHAIQTAQNHRLAIDFLTAEQLKNLYDKVKKLSLESGQQLLTEHPSDLYQLETSYFYDGKNVHLLLHVPMILKNNKLRLLKLHPFPLPLNDNFTITPEVNDDILAISPGWDRLSARLSATDLLSCHSVNKVYLCDRHGVLNKELNNTCLGALYLQDFTIARDLCQFKINPSQEVVQQLLDNWFLIHSPKVQTCFISCTNGTQKEAYIKTGITKIHLSPGCQANLIEHRLVADGSVYLPSDMTHFEWTWNAAAELQLEPMLLSNYIAELQQAGINDPTLEDLSHLKIKHSSKVNYLFHFLSFIFSSIAIGIIGVTIFFLVTKKIVLDYKKIFSCCFRTTMLVEPLEIEMQAINYPPLLNRQPAVNINANAPCLYPIN